MPDSMQADVVAADYEDEFNADEIAIAASRGCEVVYSDERTLQLDLDTDEDERLFREQYQRLRDAGIVEKVSETWSSRSGNLHVLVELAEPAPVETRILYQALLGSDRVRELLNLRRHRAGITNPIRLFRPTAVEAASTAASDDWDDDLPF